MLGQNLLNVYWFGSTASQKATKDSDIDILLETRISLTSVERDKVADIAIDLCADYGVLLDIHYYTNFEMNHAPYAHSPFIKSVTSEGVRV